MSSKVESQRIQVGILAISATVLAFQVVLTRLFAVVFSYHYTFLGISIALCGIGLGGAVVAALGARVRLGASATCFGLGILLTLAACLQGDSLGPAAVHAAIALLPFLAAGSFMARIFQVHANDAPRLYAASLLGSALGCVVVFPALKWLGAEGVVVFCALVAALTGLGFSRRSILEWGGAILAAGLAVVGLVGGGFPNVSVGVNSGKEFAEARINYTPTIEDSRWSGFARTDLVSVEELSSEKILYTDGSAPAPMLRFSGDVGAADTPRFEHFVGRIPFELAPVESALVLGSGGGRDVLLALTQGVEEITAVEVNPEMIAIVRENHDYNGDIYDRDGVQLEVREARSFLRGSDRRWDQIFVSLPRSGRSANLVGYELVENYLMTEEAIEEYLDHVNEDGGLSIVAYGDADMIKLFGTSVRLLVRRGETEREAVRHIAIMTQQNNVGVVRYLFMLKPRRFQNHELGALASLHGERGIAVGYLPGFSAQTVLSNLMEQMNHVQADFWIEELGRKQDLDLTPPTDDRPFFYKWTIGLPEELRTLFFLTFVPVLLLVGAIAGIERRGASAMVAPLAYFAFLGAGFVLVEIALVHQAGFFLGAPAISLAVTLGALLLGGGLGSTVSDRWLKNPKWIPAALVAGLALAAGWWVPKFFAFGLGWPLHLRVVAVVAVVMPLGAFMGIPFPRGLSRLAGAREAWVPWAWALNGVLSVVGSVGAVVMAITWGFSSTFSVGAGIYALAALAYRMRW